MVSRGVRCSAATPSWLRFVGFSVPLGVPGRAWPLRPYPSLWRRAGAVGRVPQHQRAGFKPARCLNRSASAVVYWRVLFGELLSSMEWLHSRCLLGSVSSFLDGVKPAPQRESDCGDALLNPNPPKG